MSDGLAIPARDALPGVVAGAAAVGVLTAIFGPAVFVGAFALAVLAGCVWRPREAALIAALSSPLNNLAVLHLPGLFDLRFLELVWATLLLTVLVRSLLRAPVPMVAPPRWFGLGLASLVGWEMVSALVNGNGLRSLVKVSQVGYFAIAAWLIAALFAALTAERRRRILRAALRVGTVLLGASLVYFVFDLAWPYVVDASLSGVDFILPSNKIQEALTGVTIVRMSAFNLSIVTTASLVAGLLGLALAVALTVKDVSDRNWAWALFALCAAIEVLTFSRAGWVVAVVVVILVAWRASPRSAFVLSAAVVVLVAALLLVPQVRSRLAEFANPNEESTSIHLELWRTAIGFADAQPIFGGGPYSFVERTRLNGGADEPPHNFIFEAAADTGWTGALLLTVLVISILTYGWRRLRGSPPLQFSLWVGLLGAVLMNLTMNGFREDMWWAWMGLMMAVAGTYAWTRSSRRAVA